MPTIDNVRVFPERAGIRERGFGTQVTGRLDDGNSIVFAELLQAWHCHFTGKPNGVLPYLNRKTLDLSNPDHRRMVSREWWKACETEPSDEFVTKVASPLVFMMHDVLHNTLNYSANFIGEYLVHQAEPLNNLQIGFAIRGYPLRLETVSKCISYSQSKLGKKIGIDQNQKKWRSETEDRMQGTLSAYFTALMVSASNIAKSKGINPQKRKKFIDLQSGLTPIFIEKSIAAQWRYAGLLTSLVEINRDGGNPVDVTKPWNLVTLRVPFDVVRDRMRGAFPVRQEDKQAIQEWKNEFGEEAAGVPLIEPRLLCFPPNLRNRIQAFEAEYGKEPAPRGDYLKPDMLLFPSITPYSDQRDGANAMIQTMLCTYDRWVRIQRVEAEPTRLEKLAARARQAAARPPQEKPPVDIGKALMSQFVQLVTAR